MPSEPKLEALCEQARSQPPELVIDVSNVCRDVSLGPASKGSSASWTRLLRLLAAWNAWEGGYELPAVRLVADGSLWALLSPGDRRELKAAVTAGFAEVHDDADPVLLDLAWEHRCVVVSNDRFTGHRRDRPWMNDELPRFVRFRGTKDGVSLVLTSLEKRTDYSLSRAEERDEMKARHISLDSGRGTELLDSVYRCDNQACFRQRFSPEGSEIPPERAPDGSAICPSCRHPLTMVGSRADTVIVRLSGPSNEVVRVPLPRGVSLILGRSSDDLSLDRLLDQEGLTKVSRHHARLTFDGRRLTIEDLGSSNGTSVQRWDRQHKRHDAGQRLTQPTPVELKPRDRAVIAGLLVIERSGRRYPFDIGSPSSGEDLPDSPATIHGTQGSR